MCDRCGWEYAYKQLREEWTGLWTCPKCWEFKHEQLTPAERIYDPQALTDPRPDPNKGDIPDGDQLYVAFPPTHGHKPSAILTGHGVTSALGTLTVAIT